MYCNVLEGERICQETQSYCKVKGCRLQFIRRKSCISIMPLILGLQVAFYVGVQLDVSQAEAEEVQERGMSAHAKQLGAVGSVRVAVRSLQGSGLRRTPISPRPNSSK